MRTRRKPAFLHLRTIRLYGHAGADVPTTYLSREEVEAEEAKDPLLHAVRLLDQAGAMAPDAGAGDLSRRPAPGWRGLPPRR